MKAGIYLITNIVNGKRYIGLSNHITRRFTEHRAPKNIKNKNSVLAKALRKYSIANFTFEVLETVENTGMLAEREAYWIKKLKPEYNMNEGGIGNKGHKLSPELKEKLKQLGQLQWKNKTDLEKIKTLSNLTGPRKGKIVSTITRDKLRAANIGKTQSEQTKTKRAEKMKLSAIGNGNGNKAIVCNETGETFPSIIIAAKQKGVHPSGITSVLIGRQKTAAGLTWNYFNL